MNQNMIQPDAIIQRYQNGIKLQYSSDRLDLEIDDARQTVFNVFKQPFNVYFVDQQNTLYQINSTCAEYCGVDSEDQAVGKKAKDLFIKESADFAVKTDNAVMLENKIQLFDQETIRHDGVIYKYLTIKSPWYDDHNNIIGVFGCSIALHDNVLASSLLFLSSLGLLDDRITKNLLSNQHQHNLSKQQLLCAKFLLSGYTAKEIAMRINLSHRSVEAYIDNMKNKLACRNKSELILKLSEILK